MSEEHLLTIMNNGKKIQFTRDQKNVVRIHGEDLSVNLGKASGKMTTELIALFAPFEAIEEENHGT